ncbi:MAG: aminotransferase class III-fold pyridoxal phosphate-dependent enzyme, partial [Oxalobacteraceae bacterium]
TPEFLRRMRELCTEYGTVLIFDEVMSGFRVGLGGAQELYGITPDLTALGKVIGGGLPVAVAAGMTTLKLVQQPGFYEKLSGQAVKLVDGLTAAAKEAGIDFCADAVGGMFGMYFSTHVPASYGQMMAGDKDRFNRFFHGMLDEGVYFAPAMFEAGFVSAAHDDAIIAETIEAARRVFAKIA